MSMPHTSGDCISTYGLTKEEAERRLKVFIFPGDEAPYRYVPEPPGTKSYIEDLLSQIRKK